MQLKTVSAGKRKSEIPEIHRDIGRDIAEVEESKSDFTAAQEFRQNKRFRTVGCAPDAERSAVIRILIDRNQVFVQKQVLCSLIDLSYIYLADFHIFG